MKIKELYDSNEVITLNSYLNKCGVKDISEFLQPTGKYLDDCFAYYNMNEAIEMFKHNMGKDTYILCDSGDVDGITSTVIMFQYMKEIDKNWDINILIHEGKERGLQDINLLEYIKTYPRPFLIIPDSGTNDFEEAEQLKEFNIDILVLDHHTMVTPIENGIIINNQDERNNVSRYGSGCLVTHKFLWALDKTFHYEFTSAEYIDMVALSLVSDIMNMSDEQNRTYYCYGLETFDCIQNPFLKALFIKFIGDGKTYTQRDIAFKIVPKLNSICRSKSQELKYILIDAFLGNKDIDFVLDKCAKAHQDQIALVNEIIENNEDKISAMSDNKLVLFSCDEMPRSYSGLIAGKVMEMCGRKPAIVGKIINDTFIGSLRSPIPLQTELDNNELVDWARGHEESCGVQIPKDNLQPLIDYYNNLNLSYEPCINVLRAYSVKDMPSNLFQLFDPYTNVLWGHGISKPIFEVHDIVYYPVDVRILGNNKRTLKITYIGEYQDIDILIFNATKQDKVDLGLGYIDKNGDFINFEMDEFPNKKILSVVGTLEINKYVGRYGKIYINNQIIVDKFKVKEYNIIRKEDLFK